MSEDAARFLVSGWEDDLYDIDPSRNPEEETEKKFLQAAEDGKLEIIKELLTENGDLINVTDKDKYTALHRACYGNHVEVVRYLLENGANTAAKTDVGWEPLHSCCHWNHKESAIILLNFGADINAVSEGGQTPLHLAATHGNYDLVQYLLMNPFIKTDLVNNTNDTASDISRRSSRFYSVFEMADPLLNYSILDQLK